MLPVEIAMSRSFTVLPELNVLRSRVLGVVADTTDPTVRTREVLLRVLHSNVGSVFSDYKLIQPDLEVIICEKRNSLEVAADLDYYQREFIQDLGYFGAIGVATEQLQIIYEAIRSNNAIMRVAGYCAAVLLGAIIEIRS
jgi:hypothetical protein